MLIRYVTSQHVINKKISVNTRNKCFKNVCVTTVRLFHATFFFYRDEHKNSDFLKSKTHLEKNVF